MKNGWFCLHRKIIEWEWYSDVATTKIFIDCLAGAYFADGEWRGIKIKKGQYPITIEKLAATNGLTTRQVRTALKNLQTTNEIEIKSTNRYSIITVKNYQIYQSESNNKKEFGASDKLNRNSDKYSNRRCDKQKRGANDKPNNNNINNITNNSNTSYINISLSSKKITKEEREILTNYVKKHNLAKSSVRAYVNAIIKNGDYVDILGAERKRLENKTTVTKQNEVIENSQEEENKIAEIQKQIRRKRKEL